MIRWAPHQWAGAPVRETVVERRLVDRCQDAGFLCWKLVIPQYAGVPDRMVVAPGRVVFVEVKRPGARPRPLQRVQHDRLRRLGVAVVVLDTLEAVDGFVDRLCADPHDSGVDELAAPIPGVPVAGSAAG